MCSYANNNPLAFSDPTGLYQDIGDGTNAAPRRGPNGDVILSDRNGKAPGGGDRSPGILAAQRAQEQEQEAAARAEYFYTYQHNLGDVSLDVAIDLFKTYPAAVFPFRVRGCDRFVTGAHCTLYPGRREIGGVGRVAVETTDTSVTFTVESEGYFDAAGSMIKFSFFERGGDAYLQQRAYAIDPSLAARMGKLTGFIKATWSLQARNLRMLIAAASGEWRH